MTKKQKKTHNKFNYWLSYFRKNEKHFDNILNCPLDKELSLNEIHIIEGSIQQFQKGENSEGKHLIAYAQKHGDKSYLETIKLFIKEEQKHALVLAKFMKANNIEKIKDHWVDNTFRSLRKLTALENSIIVLLTAEIIAAIYYLALRECTTSKTLKAICDQILLDEEMHINFQSYTLRQFYKNKSLTAKIYSRLFHRILMTGTILVVWLYHKPVLRLGGFSLPHFYRSVFNEYHRSEKMIKMKNLSIQLKHMIHTAQI
ncbi:hypothetical protein MHTCC0001_23700 [Flavobacteriaceae bacterium MHTCC 0001]